LNKNWKIYTAHLVKKPLMRWSHQ